MEHERVPCGGLVKCSSFCPRLLLIITCTCYHCKLSLRDVVVPSRWATLVLIWYFNKGILILQTMVGFNYKKAVQALNYFAEKYNGELNNMKAIKLVWLADRLHLRKYGRMITNDSYFALKNGPVPSATLNLAKGDKSFIANEIAEYACKFIKPKDSLNYQSVAPVNLKVFSKSDLEALYDVYTAFGNMNQWQLSDYSHLFSEWKRFEVELTENQYASFKIISEDFFAPMGIADAIFSQSAEILRLAKEQHAEFA